MTEATIRHLRKAFDPKMTQVEMAARTGVTVQWLRRLEKNQQQATSYTTAKKLLSAINEERAGRGMDVLTLEQLELKIA